MRLLSFLSDIESFLRAGTTAGEGGAWDTTRTVNFHHGLGRLTLQPRAGNESPGGTILIQAFMLADGSLCTKASLNWQGSDSFPTLAVYTTPQLNWKQAASRVAMTWLQGPQESAGSGAGSGENFRPLVALAG